MPCFKSFSQQQPSLNKFLTIIYKNIFSGNKTFTEFNKNLQFWTVNKGWVLGLNVIKQFMSVIYECSILARVFVPDKDFQPSLMFVSKAIN
jgi:hypothetical protein